MHRVTFWKLPVRSCPVARGGWLLAALLGTSLAASPAQAGPGSALLELQIELAELVEQDDADSVAVLRARVDDGLPPAALTSMLDACLEHPRNELEPLLQDLAAHRTSAIRARSLLAWAKLGPRQSVDAVAAAADDRDRGVRRLAVVLATLHPSERADAIVADLLAQDPGLAEEVAGRDLSGPAEGDAS